MMLEKNRHKRPSVEELMNLPWFDKYKKLNARGSPVGSNNFKAYTLTTPDSPKLQSEIEEVKSMQ
jgi:hypothetical protein